MAADQFDFTEQIHEARTEYELLEVCGQIGKAFGLPYFLMFSLPGEDDNRLSDLDLVSNWPEFLIEQYDKNGLLQHSPIISYLRSSTEPLLFEIDKINRDRADGKANFAIELFESHGIHNGAYFSVHLANGRLGAVNFSGSGNQPDHQQLVELNYLANLLYSKIHEIRKSDDELDFGLKKNEVNCLKWTSQGKTSWEIASIMGLSEHTVNHYLTSAAQNLDTSNRTHAVSKALRLKIIT